MKRAKNVDSYINGFSNPSKKLLKDLRKIILKSAPKVEERIGYGMPYYKLNGGLLYFAGHEKHIGLYPFSSAIKKFKSALKEYETSKGTIRFNIDKNIPIKLVEKIVKFRVKENLSGKR